MSKLDPNFQAFLEAAPDAIVVVDREGLIVGINGLTEEMFEYSREELIDQRLEILVPERFRARHVSDRSAYSDAPRTRPMGLDRELWGQRKSGQEFLVQISLSPIQSAGETLRPLRAAPRFDHRSAEPAPARVAIRGFRWHRDRNPEAGPLHRRGRRRG